MSRAAACENYRIGIESLRLTFPVEDLQSFDVAIFQHKVAGEGVFKHNDRGLAHRVDQGRLNRQTGSVTARVQNARMRVRRLQTARKLSVMPVEGNTDCDQVADTVRAFTA